MTVENLEINVKTNAGNAASGLKSLSDALERVGNAGRSASNVGDTVANSVKKIKKEVEPLSTDLQEAIAGATKYEVLINKAATAQMKMGQAFTSGNEERAWREREKSINATAAAARELEKQQAKIQPTTTPISIEMQGIISSASQIDVLEAKLESLKVALQDAFASGDTDKAYRLQGQILNVQAQLDKATNSANKTGDAIRNIGEEAKKSTKHTNKLWSSIKRIAMYRLLRTVIKEITQAFGDGLKAAYAFSSGLTTEGNRFAAALDSMKSATNQMKGQLGSALIGLLTAIAPILEKIINLIVKVADVMSQFFAAFTGSTYLRAVRTQAEFADITASGAKSAKEWKNQLLGFDEINKLNEPSGSGTGVNLLEGYAFEDAPISEGIMRFVERIKQAFGSLKEFLAPVWEKFLKPLGEWAINEALPAAVEFLGAAFELLYSVLEPLWEPILKPILKALADITLTGLRELTDLLKDLAKLMRGEIDFKQFIEGLDGVKIALLGIGGFLVLMGIKTLTTKIVSLMTTVLSSSFVMKAAIAGLVAYILAKLPEAISLYEQLQEQIQTQESAEKRWVENAVEGYKHLIETADKATADRFAGMAVGIDTTRMSVEDATKAIEEYARSVTQTQKTQDTFLESSMKPLSEQFESIGSQAANAFENGFGSNWNQFIRDFREKISGLGSSMNSALRGMFSNFGSAFTSKASSFTSIFSVNGYASGGLPDTGELFIANERGPELVGSLGGSTAVANNGQIEAGIEEAAYRGFVRAISSGGNRGGDVVLNINGREFARATYKDYQAAARETGGSLINNFA